VVSVIVTYPRLAEFIYQFYVSGSSRLWVLPELSGIQLWRVCSVVDSLKNISSRAKCSSFRKVYIFCGTEQTVSNLFGESFTRG
jgi:hypothetical protein